MFKALPIFLLSAFALTAHAEVKLTQQDVLGAWNIESESINADNSGAKELNAVWTFRQDGTMEGYSSDTNAHARVSEFRATLNYSIVDGKIQKQVSPGRSKMQDCTAVEKNGNKMFLNCNGIYFTMTKKQ